MPENFVFDSWAVMAWLKDEKPAAGQVQELFEQAQSGTVKLHMSVLNVGEVYYLCAKLLDRQYAVKVLEDLQQKQVKVIKASNATVFGAANLNASYALSYADAFAAQTALSLDCQLVTGDHDFLPLETAHLKLCWIGKKAGGPLTR